MKSIFKIALFLVLFFIGLAGFSFYLTVLKPLPDYTETITLDGLETPVDIHWGPYGVPQIYATSKKDLFQAIGYVHAQDRIWQMTLTQIAAEGRFAEFLGPDALPFDRYQRTLGFWRIAGRIEEQMPDSIRQMLQWYSDGVNAWTRQNRRDLPLEFSLLKMDPIPWTPRHTIALSRLMAWDQNINWWSELTLAWLAERLPEARMRELIPQYPDSKPVTGFQASRATLTSPAGSAPALPGGEPVSGSPSPAFGDRTDASPLDGLMSILDVELSLRGLLGKQGTSVGSNAWVASGSLTASGLPLLAGDPHMGLTMPGNWYEVSLHAPGFTVSGGTIPGAPFVVLGQNGKLAWSLTNVMADDTDFFLERLDPMDSTRVMVNESGGLRQSVPVTLIKERVLVKDGEDEILTIRETPNGPIINDIYPVRELVDGPLVSVRWTGHQISHEMVAIHQMNIAGSLSDFRAAAAQFKSPSMNAMYGDVDGNIAMFVMSGVPKRSAPSVGFRRGWIPSDQWREPIPFAELPSVVNPSKGWIANANNKVHDERYPYHLATFWEPPSRIERLVELFSGADSLTAETFSRWQTDVYSPHARELLDLVLPTLSEANTTGQRDYSSILPYFQNWDYAYTKNSTAASLLDVFFTTLTRNTLLDEIGAGAYENFVRLENLPVRSMKQLLRLRSPLFDDVRTEQAETMHEMILRSMDETILRLQEEFGGQPYEWRWENLHTITLAPPLFSDAAKDSNSPKALRLIVENLMSKGPYPVEGNGMTVNNGQYNWNGDFSQVLGPSIRRVIDFSDMARIRSVIPTGQSGNPMSTHFGDQTQMWLDGDHKILYQDSVFFNESTFTTMRLLPAK